MSAVRRPRGWQAAAAAVAVGLTVTFAQSPTSAAFTAQDSDTGNSVTAATSFCASPGPRVMSIAEDAPLYMATPTTSYATYASVGAISQNGQNTRSVLRFTLTAVPVHCTVVSAVLRLYATRSDVGATLDVYRIDPIATGWTESGVTWATSPGTTGAASTGGTPGTLGWHEWPVTTATAAHYAGVNSGFLLRERTEGANGAGRWHLYESKEATTVANRPQLVVTWG